jgi:N,N'-diacetyllegionaminate synthase
MTIRIGKKEIGANKPVFIIAEAGVNHNGDIQLAKKLIEAAKYAGADAVKFQTFKTEEVVSQKTRLVPYQKEFAKGCRTQFDMLKVLELTDQDHRELMSFARAMGIVLISTPGDFASVELLDKLGVLLFKIGSDDLTNVPLLKLVASKGKPILLSTGMSTLAEVKEAVRVIHGVKRVPLVVMHATTEYPCPLKDVNMRALSTIKDAFGFPVGYSDHTAGVSASMAAVSRGASVIEKHLTIDRTLPGPDHTSSYEPEEFKIFVKLIRETEECLGSAEKAPTAVEKRDINCIRKSITVKVDLPKGAVLKKEHLAIKRPQAGLLPKEYFRIIGRKLKKSVKRDTPIKKSDLI